MKKVYLAGPQVFLENPVVYFAGACGLCKRMGFEALVPLDSAVTTAPAIFAYNKALLRYADYVVADVTPFRGTEPDSGTAWEIGFAHALGIPVVMRINAPALTLYARTALHFGLVDTAPHVMPDGMSTDGFGRYANLMLEASGTMVVGNLRAALEAVQHLELARQAISEDHKALMSRPWLLVNTF